MSPEQQAAVARIGGAAMGLQPAPGEVANQMAARPAPDQGPAAAMAGAQQALSAGSAAPAPNPQAAAAPTAAEQTAAAAAPVTEGTAMQQDPVTMFGIPSGAEGAEEQYSPTQLAGMVNRYKNQNFLHARMKPVLEMAERVLQNQPGLSPEQLVGQIVNLAKGAQSNPTMGAGTGGQAASQSPDLDAWEQENGVTLPPGYKEMIADSAALRQQVVQQQQAMQQMGGAAAGMVDASRSAAQGMQGQAEQAAMQRIAFNMDQAAAKFGMQESDVPAFQEFMAEQGYTQHDFVNPDMAMQAMQNFANKRSEPELARLKSQAERRQAFMRAPGVAAGAEGMGGAQASPEDTLRTETIDRLSSRAM